ncbi:MAG: M56 family metallopeptidase [Polyangiaceae bacterium]
MSTAALVAFNLLLNALASFAVAWALARAALLVMRAPPGRVETALLALPFAKLLHDFVRGVPTGSFLWLRARGVDQDLGSFRIEVGIERGLLKLDMALEALSAGARYPQSAADLLAAGLSRHVGRWVPAAAVALIVPVALVLLARRAAAWRALASLRARLQRAGRLGWRRAGLRRVDIFLDEEERGGTPWSTGVVRPFICFPAATWTAMSAAERRAALAHELAHVTEQHLLLLLLVGFCGDLFWFVPGIGRAERAVRAGCERAADARALRRCSPVELASALVRAREATGRHLPFAGAVLGADGGEGAARISWLLAGARSAPRGPFRYPIARAALAVWVSASVLGALVLGNH